MAEIDVLLFLRERCARSSSPAYATGGRILDEPISLNLRLLDVLKFSRFFGSLVLCWREILTGKDYYFNSGQNKNKYRSTKT